MKFNRKILILTVLFSSLIYSFIILKDSTQYFCNLADKYWHKIFQRHYTFTEENKDHSLAKYILYECVDLCGGWADRLKGIMSVYAWSLITNRQFRIYTTHPCKLEKLVIPNQVNWNSKLTKNGEDIQDLENFTSYYQNSLDDQEFRQKLFNLDINNFKTEKDLITFKTNFDWMNQLSNNKYISKRIAELGFEPSKFRLYYLFKEWYNRMFKLSPELEEKYENILSQAKRTNSTKIICAQVRIGGVRPNVRFDFQFNRRDVSLLFWKFIRKKFLNLEKDYKIFVSTDLESVYEEAEKEFGKENMIKIPGLYTHIDREQFLGEDCQRVEKSILDFHFMQNCDYAVISDSGYGKLAQILMKNRTYVYIYKNGQFEIVNNQVNI